MVEMDKTRYSRLQSQERKDRYEKACEHFDEEVWPPILQAAIDRMPDFRDAQVAYDTARGAYDSDTFLQPPDIATQRRFLVEIIGMPAAFDDFTDDQVRDLYKSYRRKIAAREEEE